MKYENLKRYLKENLILGVVSLAAPFFYATLYFKKIFSKTGEPKRILIIDNAKIGDLICATPVFRAIKEKYPDANLTVLVTPRVEGILQNNRHIDEIITSNLNVRKGIFDIWRLVKEIRKRNFDVSVNLVPGTLNFILPFFAGIPERLTSINNNLGFFYRTLTRLATKSLAIGENSLSVRHYLDLLKLLGINNNNLTKEVFIDGPAEKKAAEFLASRGIAVKDVVVGMCLSAGNKIKEWGAENFAQLADEISRRFSFKIIVIGGPADEFLLKEFEQLVREDVIITYEDFSLKEVPALIRRFNYFISVDSGPIFIANALGVPVVDIVGPFNYVEQSPYYEKCEIVKLENLKCWPCLHIWSVDILKCRYGHYQCLNNITPEMVLTKFEKLVSRFAPTPARPASPS